MDLKAKIDAIAMQHFGLDLLPGQKVLDSQTGDIGEVINGYNEHRVIGAAAPAPASGAAPLFSVPTTKTIAVYSVRLASGELVQRDREDLVALPSGVNADLEDFTL